MEHVPTASITTTTTFGFCLTSQFSRDHSRLFQVPLRSPKEETEDIGVEIFIAQKS